MSIAKLAIPLVAVLIACAASASHHRHVDGVVRAIMSDYGNIDTSFEPADLQSIGVAKGDTFTVGFGDKEFEVYLGDTYSDVPRGDWVAFITADGKLRIARNFENAAQTLGVKEGDKITLFN